MSELSDQAEWQEQQAGMLRQISRTAVHEGWEVESNAPDLVVLRKPGHEVNHLLHLVLSVVTLTLWFPVWGTLAAFAARSQRRILSLDETGRFSATSRTAARTAGQWFFIAIFVFWMLVWAIVLIIAIGGSSS